jgi:hypothetical protein
MTFLAHNPRRAAPARAYQRRVDLPSVEGSLGARRGRGRASRRKSLRGTFREGIYLAWGPSGEVSGTALVSPIASDFVDGRNINIDF